MAAEKAIIILASLTLACCVSACSVKPGGSQDYSRSTTTASSTDNFGCLRDANLRRTAARKKSQEIESAISERITALKLTTDSKANLSSFAAVGTLSGILNDEANQYSNYLCWPDDVKPQLNSMVAGLKKVALESGIYSLSSNSDQSTINKLRDQITTDLADSLETQKAFSTALSK